MKKVPVGRTLLIAGACALIPLLANVVASFVKEWTGSKSWLAVPAVGVAAAMVTALIQAYGSASEPSPQPRPPGSLPPTDGPAYRPVGGQGAVRRGTPLPLAIAIAVLVIGGGGWAVAKGVRYGVGYVTGNEPGKERLTRQAQATEDGLTLAVESVKDTAHFTRVSLSARNTRDDLSMTLPIVFTAFRSVDGHTLQTAGPFKSQWTEELPPRSLQRGTITFKGHLPDSAREAELSFAHIASFPVGARFPGPGPGSITVRGIGLGPP